MDFFSIIVSLSNWYAFATLFRFVMDIFKDDGRCKNLKVIGDIPLMVPKVIDIVVFELSSDRILPFNL